MSFDHARARSLIPQLRTSARAAGANEARMKGAAKLLEAALLDIPEITSTGIDQTLRLAYVGFDRAGVVIMVGVDDASAELADQVAAIIRAGGHIERMSLEESRAAAAKLYQPTVVAEGLGAERPWKRRMAEALRAGGCSSQTEWVAKFPGVHCWFRFDDKPWESCTNCGVCRRRDDKNKPCRGIAKIELRGPEPTP